MARHGTLRYAAACCCTTMQWHAVLISALPWHGMPLHGMALRSLVPSMTWGSSMPKSCVWLVRLAFAAWQWAAVVHRSKATEHGVADLHGMECCASGHPAASCLCRSHYAAVQLCRPRAIVLPDGAHVALNASLLCFCLPAGDNRNHPARQRQHRTCTSPSALTPTIPVCLPLPLAQVTTASFCTAAPTPLPGR